MPRTQWIGGNLRLAMPEVPRIGRSQQRLRCGLRKGKREGFYQRTASALEFWMVELPIAAGAAAAAHRLGRLGLGRRERFGSCFRFFFKYSLLRGH